MTVGEMRERARVQDRDVPVVIVTIEQIELGQHARDRAEERPYIEMEVIDLGGEA